MTNTRVPVSTRCSAEIWEAARSASQGMLRRDPTYSLSRLVEDALTAEVTRLSAEFNDGEEWPRVPTLRRGRRVAGSRTRGVAAGDT